MNCVVDPLCEGVYTACHLMTKLNYRVNTKMELFAPGLSVTSCGYSSSIQCYV